ncbi:putative glycolipid-binding domain-containing protein [Amycolatopsis sp. NPDC089917]|uniref:putative glycolipid-binding domain-containing protein n=1 Tax=Amycolatopsis sp. NPDC089917 TaxID=3155187 RepID=UPI003427E1E1
MLFWTGADQWRTEVCEVGWSDTSLTAIGTQAGVAPLPYRLDYSLTTGDEFVTDRLDVTVRGEHWNRRLCLTRIPGGTWTVDADHQGMVGLPDPGGDPAALEGALDCDLGRSPLTNVMPVRRHRLHEQAGGADFLMAWVSVPDLSVHPSRQRYEHLHPPVDGIGQVRYIGAHRGFEGDLDIDAHGFVLNYPGLARRVPAPASADTT